MKLRLYIISLKVINSCQLIWKLSVGWVFTMLSKNYTNELVTSLKEQLKFKQRKLNGDLWWQVVTEEWDLTKKL
jgi:hypothetical protein